MHRGKEDRATLEQTPRESSTSTSHVSLEDIAAQPRKRNAHQRPPSQSLFGAQLEKMYLRRSQREGVAPLERNSCPTKTSNTAVVP